MTITFDAHRAAGFLAGSATSVVAFRGLLGAGADLARPLGHHQSAGFSYAAFDVTGAYEAAKTVQRSFARSGAILIGFDLIVAVGEHHWTLEGTHPNLYLASLLPDNAARAETPFLHAASLATPPEPLPVDSGVDLAGARFGPVAVFFHNEPRMNRSALAFAVEDGPAALDVFVIGVAPGSWQLWRNGWLDESLTVKPEQGLAAFKTRPGRFFLRRLS